MPLLTVEVRTTPFQIAASPAEVFAVLADVSTWPVWAAGFGLRARTVAVGAPCLVQLPLLPGPRPPLPARFTVADATRGLAWAGGVPGVVTATHGFELAPVAGGTRVTHGEVFHGLGTPALGILRDSMRALYERMNAGLRDHVETRAPVR